MFADDIVLLADTETGLQNSIRGILQWMGSSYQLTLKKQNT